MKSTKVILLGELGERFAPELDLFVSSPKEAIIAINANFPGFSDYVSSNPEQLYKLTVSDGEKWEVEIDHSNNLFPCAGKIITIAPIAAGSGGLGKILMGVALLGIGIATGGTGLIIAGALALGQALFFGNPDSPDPEEDAKQSLVFSGQTTTTAEGNRIPIPCGHKYRIGVQIVSFGIKSEYVAD